MKRRLDILAGAWALAGGLLLAGPASDSASADNLPTYEAAIGAATEGPLPALPRQRALALGHRIWRNESNQSYDGLTAWNRGEEFASLGIGHFIWYPAGVPRKFKESFPELVAYLAQVSAQRQRSSDAPPPTVPSWLLGGDVRCPWDSRLAFERDFNSPRMLNLRQFLGATIAEQSAFIARRLSRSLPDMLAFVSPAERGIIYRRFLSLYTTDAGLYALIDYVNFKGEGTAVTERYQGQGWGLLQVLQTMDTSPGTRVTDAFADAAEAVLQRRITLSPPERNERRWMPGWSKRIDSYRVMP